MKRLDVKKNLLILFFAVAVLWIAYRFLVQGCTSVETQSVFMGDTEDIIKTTGFVVRDEMLIGANGQDVQNLKYFFSDGEKVSRNGVIAEVYKTPEDAEIGYKVEGINKETEILEKLGFSKYSIAKGINFINEQINGEIKKLILSSADNKFLDREDYRKKILYLLNEKQIILGKDVGAQERIKNLNDEKSRLLSRGSPSIACITAPQSGEFVSCTDGYEEKICCKNILKDSYENLDFDNFGDPAPISDCAGKIIKCDTWYMICKISAEEASRIKMGAQVKVSFASLDLFDELLCSAESVVKERDSENFILILSCDYMNKNLASLRKEEITLNLGNYTGIKVDKNALHQRQGENGETGVYVRLGSYLIFKKAVPIFLTSSYAVCEYNSDQEADRLYLQPGDLVVTGGSELYEGKKVL